MKNLFILTIAFCIAAITPTSSIASAISAQEARTEHMRTCLGNGGTKELCMCSFERTSKALGVGILSTLNRAIASKIPADEKSLRIFMRISEKCAQDVERGKYVPEIEGDSIPTQPPVALESELPPLSLPNSLSNNGQSNFDNLNNLTIPQPPPLTKSSPDFNNQASTDSYFDDIDSIENESLAQQNQFNQKDVPLDVKIANLRDSYQGQHDRVFFVAAAKGDLQGLNAVNQYLKSPDLIDANGNTPLLVAVLNGRFEATKFLISKGANVNAQNKAGQTPLHIAVFNRRPDITQMLILHKSNINAKYGNGFTPVILAIMNRDEVILQSLLIAGADIKTAMTDGNLPIHVAVTTDNSKILQVLKNYGANLDAENGQGYTPLMIAASQNKVAAASALLALGANYNLADIYGRTAAQIAFGLGNQQIVNLVLTMQEKQNR